MKLGSPLALMIAAAAALASAVAVPASAAPASSNAVAKVVPAATASPDFDGDGKADFAAAIYLDQPGNDNWGVRIWYGSGTVTTIDPSSVGASLFDMDGPLLARDLNSDGYTDLVFSTARYDRGARVTIALGSASGLKLSSAHEIVVSTSTSAAPVSLAFVETPKPRLAVGLLGGAGSVALYDLNSSGLPVGGATTLKSATGKIPTITGSDAKFGYALASSDNRLFIGAPYATVGGQASAGAMVTATLATTGVSSAKLTTQSTAGVVGVAEKQDRFGYSLAARDGYLVVGTPGDDVLSILDTGSVGLFSLAGGALKPIRRDSEASTGVPGKAERYDDFGSSVALGSVCAGVPSMVIGGDGEEIATNHKNAGAVWLIKVSGTGCASQQIYEGHGLGGSAKAGVKIGAYVGVLRDQGKSVDDVLVGGSGGFSEGPSGRLIRWSPSAAATFRFEQLIGGIAGR